jgi:tetratricopeptide (TPR) repeat protein
MFIRKYPNIKVFIDGRTDQFSANFFKMYLKIWDEGRWDLFEEQVKKFNIKGAVLSSHIRPIPDKFLRQIYSHPAWKLIYFDYDGVIFLKDVPENRDAIARLAVNLTRWRTNPADVNLSRYPTYGATYYNRAMTLKTLGFYEQAEKEMEEALRINPTNVKAILLKANIYLLAGKAEQALYLFQEATQYAPKSIGVMMEAALAYEGNGDYDRAFLFSQKMIRQAPKDPRGYFVLEKLLARRTQYPGSSEALEKAYRLKLEVGESP